MPWRIEGGSRKGTDMRRIAGELLMSGTRRRAGAVAYAISTLEDQAMPSEEIAEMVRARDPELVRRYLELHRERLEERLADQQRTLDLLERLLIAAWGGSGIDRDIAIEGTRTTGSYRMHPNGGSDLGGRGAS